MKNQCFQGMYEKLRGKEEKRNEELVFPRNARKIKKKRRKKKRKISVSKECTEN